MLLTRLFEILLAVAVVSAGGDTRPVTGTVQFCEGDVNTHFYGQCAGGDVDLTTCYDIKDGLFGQNLGNFNDKIALFRLMTGGYYCLLYDNYGCGGEYVSMDINSKFDNLGSLANRVSAFQCWAFYVWS